MKKTFSILSSLAVLASFNLHGDEVTAPAMQGRSQNFTSMLLMVGIAIVFFYFIIWRPEQKRRKTMEKKRAALKKGDQVNAMGIVGKVDEIKEHTIVLKMYDGAKVEFLKGAITEIYHECDDKENCKGKSGGCCGG